MRAGDQVFFIGYLLGKIVQVYNIMMKTLLQALLDIYLMEPRAGDPGVIVDKLSTFREKRT
jgi:hypothetical protein